MPQKFYLSQKTELPLTVISPDNMCPLDER